MDQIIEQLETFSEKQKLKLVQQLTVQEQFKLFAFEPSYAKYNNKCVYQNMFYTPYSEFCREIENNSESIYSSKQKFLENMFLTEQQIIDILADADDIGVEDDFMDIFDVYTRRVFYEYFDVSIVTSKQEFKGEVGKTYHIQNEYKASEINNLINTVIHKTYVSEYLKHLNETCKYTANVELNNDKINSLTCVIDAYSKHISFNNLEDYEKEIAFKSNVGTVPHMFIVECDALVYKNGDFEPDSNSPISIECRIVSEINNPFYEVEFVRGHKDFKKRKEEHILTVTHSEDGNIVKINYEKESKRGKACIVLNSRELNPSVKTIHHILFERDILI